MEYDVKTFIFAAVLAIFVVAGLMSAYKAIYYRITKKSTITLVNQILAWVFSYAAVVLCWWTIRIPSEFRQTFLYVFAVYVLQRFIDLKMIKRILEGALKKRGLISDGEAESDSSVQ